MNFSKETPDFYKNQAPKQQLFTVSWRTKPISLGTETLTVVATSLLAAINKAEAHLTDKRGFGTYEITEAHVERQEFII